MSRILSLHDVCCTYGEPPMAACVGVNLAIERRELAAVVGPSGSGKSILLNLIGTLGRSTSGTVEIDGIGMSRLSDRKLLTLRARLIGFVFRQFHLSKGMDAIDNVANGLLYLGVPRAERRQKTETALIRVGLSHHLYHRPHQMSDGERQCVATARAVVDDLPLLLADEPTGNLDSVSDASIMELLHELYEQGTTIVVITHNSDLILQLPRQIAIKDERTVHDSVAKEVAHA